MKAWFVYISDEWGELVHAETRGKAKVKVMREFDVDEYICLGAIRKPKLDNKPFTFENLEAANFHYFDEDGEPLTIKDFYNSCKCELCYGKET